MESVNVSQEISSFLHNHRLCLHPEMKHRRCDVCREPVEGTFYRCDCCDFDVHPTCTRLPHELRHVLDPDHKLTLHKLSSGRCSVCEADCSSLWVYGCTLCQVHIHPMCVPKPCHSKSGTRGVRCWPPKQPQQQQQQQPHHFYGGYPTGGYPNFIGGGYNGDNNYWYNHNTYHHHPPPPQPYNYYYYNANPRPDYDTYYHHHPPPPQPYNYYYYNANPRPDYDGYQPSPSTITFGSVIGGATLALVESLTTGAIVEFVFGVFGA